MAIRRVLVLIQVGGRADEGGCAALVTLGASRLGRRNKHTPPQPKQLVNGKQGDGGQGAPLTRLRCPVVPAARKLVFMPLLLLSVLGVVILLHGSMRHIHPRIAEPKNDDFALSLIDLKHQNIVLDHHMADILI